jgi:putative transposase
MRTPRRRLMGSGLISDFEINDQVSELPGIGNMPRRPRTATAGLTFHLMNRTAQKIPLFECADDYTAFERILFQAIHRSDVAVFAYCLMPNHWHLVASARVDGALSRFMHWLTTTHARRWRIVKKSAGQGAVYQGRFRAVHVTSDDHFLCVCRYVERNALRARLVDRAEEWQWSSLWRRCGHADARSLARWPVKEPGDWLELVNANQTLTEIDSCRCTQRRRALAASFGTRNESRPLIDN